MPANKHALLRYNIIDECLRNKRSINKVTLNSLLEKISEKGLKTSISMLRKDIEAMKLEFDAPIKYNRANNEYTYTNPNYSLNAFPLTEDETDALDFSVAILEKVKFSSLYKNYKGAIEKIINGIQISKILDFKQEKVLQVEAPLQTFGSEWLEILYNSIIRKEALLLSYKGFAKDAKQHILSAYVLKEYKNLWYVIGYSNINNKTLVFALDRVTEIQPTKERYYKDEQFNIDEYFKYSFGITHYYNFKPEKVILEITGYQKNYVLTKPLHQSQKITAQSNEKVTIELFVFISPELTSTILSMGEDVKVIEPKALVTEIKERIAKMKKLY